MGNDWQAGEVRQTQLIIGPDKGCGVLEASDIPPPPGEPLNGGLSAWEKWIHAEGHLHALIRVHLLREVSTRGAWDEWIGFFRDAIAEQAADAEARIRALLAWRDSTLAMLRAGRVKGVAIAVTDKLLEHPTVTVKNIADSNSVSAQAANNAVTRLVDLGVLAEITGRSYNRVFSAPAAFDILFRTGSSAQTPQSSTLL